MGTNQYKMLDLLIVVHEYNIVLAGVMAEFLRT